ncbi:hypothetical protein [Crocosphaera sp. XPORK-15E]|uniref:hypothetical protein n=1 Tax=Crocosphaera sp. XPORK-15E TaxID=3110247 RepID=UPI002B209AAF|nr:hypothetical protein [Crocosphaera sp. XPORK-15E]MEA5537353.1 hypothetical protein [Crocosphaera sp. XPORK-15E]
MITQALQDQPKVNIPTRSHPKAVSLHECDIPSLTSNIKNQINFLGRTIVETLLNLAEDAWKIWNYYVEVAKTANPKRYIRKAQSQFKEWRRSTGHPQIIKMAMNFYQWFSALPEPFQAEAFDITQWSFSALNQLTKIPLNMASYAIAQGKDGLKHTVKSIKCLFSGSGKKYLELGKRGEENDWQLVTEKLKKLSEDDLVAIKNCAVELAQKAQRPLCEATGQIEPWTDDIIEALGELEYDYHKLLKPEKKQYTQSQFLSQQQYYEDKLVAQNEITSQQWLKQEQYYEEKLVTQTQKINQLEQQYQSEITALKQQIENLTNRETSNNSAVATTTTVLNTENPTEVQPTQPSPKTDNPTRLASQFIPNAPVAIVKDNEIVNYGKMLKKVGEKILVKLNDGLSVSYQLSQLVLVDKPQKSTQKKSSKKSKGFGYPVQLKFT